MISSIVIALAFDNQPLAVLFVCMHMCRVCLHCWSIVDTDTMRARLIYVHARDCKAHWKAITKGYAYKLYIFKFTITLVVALQLSKCFEMRDFKTRKLVLPQRWHMPTSRLPWWFVCIFDMVVWVWTNCARARFLHMIVTAILQQGTMRVHCIFSSFR